MFALKLDEIPEQGLDLQWKEEKASLLGLREGPFENRLRLRDPAPGRGKDPEGGPIRLDYGEGRGHSSIPMCQMLEGILLSSRHYL